MPAFLLSAGSEVVATSLADELLEAGIPLVVVSLGKPSLLRDVPGVMAYQEIPWPPSPDAVADLIGFLKSAHDGPPMPAFGTDDGGLRWLFEHRQELQPQLTIPGARRLPWRGLDKAELFDALQEAGLEHHIAPFMNCHSIEQAAEAVQRFGDDVIIKPSLKPFDMTLPSAYCKVVTRGDDETVHQMLARLEAVWDLSDCWIAQARLTVHAQGEALFWAFRAGDGAVHGLTAFERWKQPITGGTGAWVETCDLPGLEEAATAILDAIDLTGLAELPFLVDPDGRWRLIEINPRAWLQVALGRAAGMPLALAAYRDALGEPLPPLPGFQPGSGWTSPERLLQSVFSKDYGPWWKEIFRAASVVRGSRHVAVYSSKLPKVRRRWVRRCLQKVMGN